MTEEVLSKEEEIKRSLEDLEESLNNCMLVSSSRPYQYEHNHFVLTEKIAMYLLLKEYEE